MNMGDFHYQDIRTNRASLFRAAYDAVLASPQQADLYRSVPFVYMWDDHDYGGNNASRKSTTHEAARNTYEEYVPHYPFAYPDHDAPISQTFVVGRVKFILTDLRSDRSDPKDKDDANKTILGTSQKQWLKQELLSSNGKYPLICWMSSVPWIGVKGKSPYRDVRTNSSAISTTRILSSPRVPGRIATGTPATMKIIGACSAPNGGRSPTSSNRITFAASAFFMATRTCSPPITGNTPITRPGAARRFQ
jgi:alkaline phosphatase D